MQNQNTRPRSLAWPALAALLMTGCRSTDTVASKSSVRGRPSIETPKSEEKASSSAKYSFFVAGHTYGRPQVNNMGLHPPFEKASKEFAKESGLKFGVLTGDIVISSTKANWDEVDAFLKSLKIPVHFAPGNHDLTNRKLFESRYGKTIYEFKHEGDLFVFLDPNLDHWNISGEQLGFLKRTLGSFSDPKGNIFVFFHQVLWWEPNGRFQSIRINNPYDRADKINFWSTVVPLLTAKPNPVFCFAGDVGALGTNPGYFSSKLKNVTLTASGMGSGHDDNYLIVKVYPDRTVSIEKRPLRP